MGKVEFENVFIVLEDKVISGSITVKDNLIDKITPHEIGNREEALILAPGVIDLHTHGSGGFDFMDGSKEDIINASQSIMQHGVTTVLPTTLTCSDEDLFRFFDNYNSIDNFDKLPHLEGIHLEGPYFSYNERGAQDPRFLKTPNKNHYMAILERSRGNIKRWTIAPELNGAMEMLDDLKDSGILFAAGHTEADYNTIKKAVDKGVKMLTHFYSGMSLLKRVGGFRVLGAVECGYIFDELTVECISDGKHLPPELLSMIFKLKDNDKIVSCSDSMRGAGMAEGPSILGPKGNGVECIIEDGIAKMPDRTCFAGSVATGETIINTLGATMGFSLDKVFRICSLNPARLINIDSKTGSIKEGKEADLIVLDKSLKLQSVYVSGVEKYRR